MMRIDGEPATRSLSETGDLQLVVNASWDLFQSKKTSTYYMLMGKHWLKSKKLEGPWKPTRKLPKSFKSLPNDDRFAQARAAVPADKIGKKDVPKIFVSTEPAELIVTDGAPKLEDIAQTSLFFVSNTTSDIIYDNESLKYYFLTSGRWFTASALEGPWASAGNLPDSFQQIPADHSKAHVRSSIPDTIEATFAVLEAQVPKTAVISRDLEAPEISYYGDPKFEEIENLSVSRAVNTDKEIFLVSGKYYLCHKAVWFISETAEGPWVVAESVPSEIYDIPSTHPSHHVTYVTTSYNTSGHIHYSYTSGYHHSYISYGLVVYGSGYYGSSYYGYYDPFYSYPHWGYPYYYPHAYGSASFYNPRTGTYGHGHYTYGPYGGGWAGERYNPRSGRYGQGEAAWDYNTGIYQGRSYNPRNDIGTSTRQEFQYHGNNEYESWGESKVQRGDDWIKSERYSNQDGSRYRFESSKGGEGGRIVTDGGAKTAIRTGDGDLYAGKNGNVFRKTSDGSWEKRGDGSWNPVERQPADRDWNKTKSSLSDDQKQSLQNRASKIDRSQQDRNLESPFRSESISKSKKRSGYESRSSSGSRGSLDRDSYKRGYGNQRYQNYQRSGGSSNRGSRSSGSTRSRRR